MWGKGRPFALVPSAVAGRENWPQQRRRQAGAYSLFICRFGGWPKKSAPSGRPATRMTLGKASLGRISFQWPENVGARSSSTDWRCRWRCPPPLAPTIYLMRRILRFIIARKRVCSNCIVSAGQLWAQLLRHRSSDALATRRFLFPSTY